MPLWIIKSYGNDRRSLFEEEYRAQGAAVRAEFRAVLNGLRDQPRDLWTRPSGYDQLSGQYRVLGKLRFKVGAVQHRPLGFVGPGLVFTLLIWATERDSQYSPPGVRDTALERRQAILEGTKVAYEFDLEEIRG